MKKGNDHGKNKYGMVINLDKCTGCGTCMVACASENNVSVRPDESDKERFIAWMQLFKADNGKELKRSPQTDCNIKKDSNEVSNSSLGIIKEEKSNNDVNEDKTAAPSTVKIITHKCKVCDYETSRSSQCPTTDIKNHMGDNYVPQ